VDDVAEAYLAGWLLLMEARSLEHLREIVVAPSGATGTYQFGSVSEVMAAEKRAWVDDFRGFKQEILAADPSLPSRLPERGDSAEALETFVKLLQERVDDLSPGSVPRASLRLDAFLRVHALLHLRFLRRKAQYNPEKDANDALDHHLLSCLAHPVAVCTSEKGLPAEPANPRVAADRACAPPLKA